MAISSYQLDTHAHGLGRDTTIETYKLWLASSTHHSLQAPSLGNHQGSERCLNLTAVEPDNPPIHEELTNRKEECQWIFSHCSKGLLGQQDSLCPLDSECSLVDCLLEVWSITIAQKARDLCSQMCAEAATVAPSITPWNRRLNHPILSGWILRRPLRYITVAIDNWEEATQTRD